MLILKNKSSLFAFSFIFFILIGAIYYNQASSSFWHDFSPINFTYLIVLVVILSMVPLAFRFYDEDFINIKNILIILSFYLFFFLKIDGLYKITTIISTDIVCLIASYFLLNGEKDVE